MKIKAKCSGISNSECGKWIHYTFSTCVGIKLGNYAEQINFNLRIMADAEGGFVYTYGEIYDLDLTQEV